MITGDPRDDLLAWDSSEKLVLRLEHATLAQCSFNVAVGMSCCPARYQGRPDSWWNCYCLKLPGLRVGWPYISQNYHHCAIPARVANVSIGRWLGSLGEGFHFSFPFWPENVNSIPGPHVRREQTLQSCFLSPTPALPCTLCPHK